MRYTSFEDIPQNGFEIVALDPPWYYYGSPDKWAAAGKHYDLMTTQEIAEVPIRSIMTKESIAFLWATGPKLDEAIHVMQRWGLHYRGVAFVWVKTRKDGKPIGAQGVRPSITKPLTEFVLAGSPQKLGRPLKLSDESIPQTVFAPRGRHSEKPLEVMSRIEKMYPSARKIELFARSIVPGWDRWGLEAP